MFSNDQYQLLDFGQGRKLESFGGLVVDRPAPAAKSYSPTQLDLWADAAARFDMADETGGPERGAWQWPGGDHLSRESHFVLHQQAKFELGWTPFGHVGLFPEQAANWDWIAERLAGRSNAPRVLNLFAYTGGSTLAAAKTGAEVTHVDASRSSVAWARRNAGHSGLAEAPIRWLVEDVLRYTARELRRGRQYEGIVLDPPSYGHGPKGEQWQIDEHLPELMHLCGELLSEQPSFLLLSCHSPTWPQERLEQKVRESIASAGMQIESGAMMIESLDGRELDCGSYVRASR